MRREEELVRPCRSPRRRAALLAALLLAAPAASRAAEADWFPLRGDVQRVYEVHRDHTYHPEDAKIDRVFHAGRMTETIVAAPERAPGGFLVRDVLNLAPVAGAGSPETFAEWTVLSFQNELRIHASGATDERGQGSEAVYAPPLRFLPTTAVGDSWKVGTYRSGDRQAELRGTVLGIEDVAGKPAWSKCLKVRLDGALTGRVPVYDGFAEIEAGTFERLLWLARGTGIVRAVTTIEAKLRLPDGKRADTVQVLTVRLVDSSDSP